VAFDPGELRGYTTGTLVSGFSHTVVGGPAHALSWLLRGESRVTLSGDSADSRPYILEWQVGDLATQ